MRDMSFQSAGHLADFGDAAEALCDATEFQLRLQFTALGLRHFGPVIEGERRHGLTVRYDHALRKRVKSRCHKPS